MRELDTEENTSVFVDGMASEGCMERERGEGEEGEGDRCGMGGERY
jgi:hypothetical protein